MNLFRMIRWPKIPRQLQRGHTPPAKSQVDEYIRQERESWER